MGLLEIENSWDSFAFADFENASAAATPVQTSAPTQRKKRPAPLKKVDSIVAPRIKGSAASMLQEFSFNDNQNYDTDDTASVDNSSTWSEEEEDDNNSLQRYSGRYPTPLPPSPNTVGRRHSDGAPHILTLAASRKRSEAAAAEAKEQAPPDSIPASNESYDNSLLQIPEEHYSSSHLRKKSSPFDMFGDDEELQSAQPTTPLQDFNARIQRDRDRELERRRSEWRRRTLDASRRKSAWH